MIYMYIQTWYVHTCTCTDNELLMWLCTCTCSSPSHVHLPHQQLHRQGRLHLERPLDTLSPDVLRQCLPPRENSSLHLVGLLIEKKSTRLCVTWTEFIRPRAYRLTLTRVYTVLAVHVRINHVNLSAQCSRVHAAVLALPSGGSENWGVGIPPALTGGPCLAQAFSSSLWTCDSDFLSDMRCMHNALTPYWS